MLSLFHRCCAIAIRVAHDFIGESKSWTQCDATWWNFYFLSSDCRRVRCRLISLHCIQKQHLLSSLVICYKNTRIDNFLKYVWSRYVCLALGLGMSESCIELIRRIWVGQLYRIIHVKLPVNIWCYVSVCFQPINISYYHLNCCYCTLWVYFRIQQKKISEECDLNNSFLIITALVCSSRK